MKETPKANRNESGEKTPEDPTVLIGEALETSDNLKTKTCLTDRDVCLDKFLDRIKKRKRRRPKFCEIVPFDIVINKKEVFGDYMDLYGPILSRANLDTVKSQCVN